MKTEYLEGGRICTAHGVKGEVKVEHYCDTPSVLAKQRKVYIKHPLGDFTERAVLSSAVAGQFVILRLEGIDSREAAIALRGVSIYLHRDSIPKKEGSIFIADMIGLPVIHAERGELLGEIGDVSDIAGRRIYTVKTARGDVLLPDVPEFIKEISEEAIKVLPISGFFDDAE